jgi:hypothetical protein
MPTRTKLLTNVRGGEKPGGDTPRTGGPHNRHLPSEIILFFKTTIRKLDCGVHADAKLDD